MSIFKTIWLLGGKTTDLLVEGLNRVLSSKIGLLIAIIGPLVVIPASQSVKNVENIISSNWTQLWALFVLGIMQSRTAHKVNRVHKHLGLDI